MLRRLFKKLFRSSKKEEFAAEISYKVDAEGDIWLDFKWKSDVNKNAAKMFSELFVEVSSGGLVDSSLEFLENKFKEMGSEEDYDGFLQYINLLQDIKFMEQMTDEIEEQDEDDDDQPLIRPTEVANIIETGTVNDSLNN
tara:strand:+ start:1531 stop:1950 length:420 start_codon:yes stop_codon:yes gene_type:complete